MCDTVEQTKFYSSKQLVETFSVKRNAEVFFKADSMKKATNDRSYVRPIIMRLDGERHDDIDFNFNLNVSTVEIIKRHPTREFWVISIDATSVKQFIDKEGHDQRSDTRLAILCEACLSNHSRSQNEMVYAF